MAVGRIPGLTPIDNGTDGTPWPRKIEASILLRRTNKRSVSLLRHEYVGRDDPSFGREKNLATAASTFGDGVNWRRSTINGMSTA